MRTPLVLLSTLWASVGFAATFTVTNTNPSGAGSLQQAITDANANAGPDEITFNLPPAGLSITRLGPLPEVIDPVTIDGTSQPGFAGAPIIELKGMVQDALVDGLRITTSNCVVRGLVINQFTGNGVVISGGRSNGIEGCLIGLNVAGDTDQGSAIAGILITNSVGNVVGGTSPAARNVISGNGVNGIVIGGSACSNNVVVGNFIGTYDVAIAAPLTSRFYRAVQQ